MILPARQLVWTGCSILESSRLPTLPRPSSRWATQSCWGPSQVGQAASMHLPMLQTAVTGASALRLARRPIPPTPVSLTTAPSAGIMLFDYYCVRHRQLDLDALYSDSPTAAYWYRRGWNPAALLALAAGAAPTLPGLLHTLLGTPVPRIFVQLYTAAWFVGFFAAGLVYWALMSRPFWLRPQEALVGTAA